MEMQGFVSPAWAISEQNSLFPQNIIFHDSFQKEDKYKTALSPPRMGGPCHRVTCVNTKNNSKDNKTLGQGLSTKTADIRDDKAARQDQGCLIPKGHGDGGIEGVTCVPRVFLPSWLSVFPDSPFEIFPFAPK